MYYFRILVCRWTNWCKDRTGWYVAGSCPFHQYTGGSQEAWNSSLYWKRLWNSLNDVVRRRFCNDPQQILGHSRLMWTASRYLWRRRDALVASGDIHKILLYLSVDQKVFPYGWSSGLAQISLKTDYYWLFLIHATFRLLWNPIRDSRVAFWYRTLFAQGNFQDPPLSRSGIHISSN